MPQVDLSSVCAGGVAQDNKVSCETLADTSTEDPPPPAPPIDYAPESFWLSKDAELDWLDQNAFIERKDSGKGGPPTNPNPTSTSISSSSSQRYSVNLKSKASIIGLPKSQKQNYAEAKNRRTSCRPASIKLFPKRSEPVGTKPGVGLSEPSSPKVSCMGRVRSRKVKIGSGMVRSRSIKTKRNKKIGFWNNIKFMFRSKGGKGSRSRSGTRSGSGCKGDEGGVEPESSVVRKKRGLNFNCEVDVVEVNRVVPGLGGVKRFASGRKSDGWAGDLEFDGAKSEPLDNRGGGPIWRRREKGPPVEVEVDRDWMSVGPASV